MAKMEPSHLPSTIAQSHPHVRHGGSRGYRPDAADAAAAVDNAQDDPVSSMYGSQPPPFTAPTA